MRLKNIIDFLYTYEITDSSCLTTSVDKPNFGAANFFGFTKPPLAVVPLAVCIAWFGLDITFAMIEMQSINLCVSFVPQQIWLQSQLSVLPSVYVPQDKHIFKPLWPKDVDGGRRDGGGGGGGGGGEVDGNSGAQIWPTLIRLSTILTGFTLNLLNQWRFVLFFFGFTFIISNFIQFSMFKTIESKIIAKIAAKSRWKLNRSKWN